MRKRSLAGRIAQHMQDTKIEEVPEVQAVNTSVGVVKAKSTFDNAEYERWSAKLRNCGRSASK